MIPADDKFSLTSELSDFAKPTFPNQKTNIISGPNTKPWEKGMMYWTHSTGNETPMEREEGPFPVQGNIGKLVKDEVNDFRSCSLASGRVNEVGGSRNCTTTFYPDQFTTKDTCGTECILSSPESFGDKNFGFEDGSNYFTNVHGLHAYKNIRAGGVGQSSKSGCYESIPGIAKSGTGTCMMSPNPVYEQVGNWTSLPENKSIIAASFPK